MSRPEYLSRNPRLQIAQGALALRVNPEDASKHGLKAGERVKIDVSGVTRRLVVKVDERVPAGVSLVPAVPEQPCGLANVDLSSARPDPVMPAPPIQTDTSSVTAEVGD
jgi:anaerobic selenocysteine-containing dehydrogenase